MKLLKENHEICLICFIPKRKCSNKYYEFISCLCMAKQSNKFLIDNHETDSVPFPEENATTFYLYFHDRDIDYGHGYKGNFVHHWQILANKMKVYIIIIKEISYTI